MAKGLLSKKPKKKNLEPGTIMLPDTESSEDEDEEEEKRKEEARKAREARERKRQGFDDNALKDPEMGRRHFVPKKEDKPAKSAEAYDLDPYGKDEELLEDPNEKKLRLDTSTTALDKLDKMISASKAREGDDTTRKTTIKDELKEAQDRIKTIAVEVEKTKKQRETLLDLEDVTRDLDGLVTEKGGKVKDAWDTLKEMEGDIQKTRWTGVDEFGRLAQWPSPSFKEDRRGFLHAVHVQLMKDIGKGFSQLKDLLEPFYDFKKKYRGLYTSAYFPLVMKEVAYLHVQMEMLWWDPLGMTDADKEDMVGRPIIAAPSLDDFEWFQALCDYSMEKGDPDSQLVPQVVIDEIYPIIVHYLNVWDIRDPVETKRLCAVVEEAKSFLEKRQEPLQLLENTLKGRIDRASPGLTPEFAAMTGKNLSLFFGIFPDTFLGPLIVSLWKDRISMELPDILWPLTLHIIPDNELRRYFQDIEQTLHECRGTSLESIATDIIKKIRGPLAVQVVDERKEFDSDSLSDVPDGVRSDDDDDPPIPVRSMDLGPEPEEQEDGVIKWSRYT